MMIDQDIVFMQRAVQLAKQAQELGEVPVGAVLVHNNRMIGEGFNQRESQCNPLGHAELLAVQQAASRLQQWRLLHCTLYVTLEPCPMCAGALVNARVSRLVFGAADPKSGACGSVMQLCQHPKLNHQLQVDQGVLAAQCRQLLQDFFKQLRRATSQHNPGAK